jgi:hypothetical protein
MHDHPGHTHDHAGEHSHTKEEALKLLQYTLQHNTAHADELHELGHLLEELGLDGAASEVWYSLDDAKCSNEHIERAIAAIDN